MYTDTHRATLALLFCLSIILDFIINDLKYRDAVQTDVSSNHAHFFAFSVDACDYRCIIRKTSFPRTVAVRFSCVFRVRK